MGDAKYDIFISHRSLDDRLADELAGALERQGLTCFVDHRDLGPGWADGMPEALERSAALLVLVTENSVDGRDHIFNEVDFARQTKPIIGVTTIDFDPGRNLFFHLGGTSFRAWRTDEDLEGIAEWVARRS